LTVTVRGQCEVWERDFDGLRVASVQRPDGLLLAEVFGRLAICFRLESQDGGLRFVQERAQVRLGAIHLLIPSIVAPRVSASETPVGDNGFKANVSVRVPVVGLILAYEGLLHLEADL